MKQNPIKNGFDRVFRFDDAFFRIRVDLSNSKETGWLISYQFSADKNGECEIPSIAPNSWYGDLIDIVPERDKAKFVPKMAAGSWLIVGPDLSISAENIRLYNEIVTEHFLKVAKQQIER